jgi:hypothetical protein
MIRINGNGKLISALAAIASGCLIVTALWSYYMGWEAKIEASIVEQRMVNAHDSELRDILPKVEMCHGVNEHQQWQIDQNARDIGSLTAQVKETHEMVQEYLQAMMKEGRIPR